MFAKRALGIVLSIGFIVSSTALLRAGDDAQKKDHEHPAPKASKAQPALERIKQLAGDWVYADGEKKGELGVKYTISGGGSFVVETIFPGTSHEMVTVYNLDGDKLMLTHYCAAGNAPRMHADAANPDGPIKFACTGGADMAEGDGHMHAMTMTFVDADHLKHEWTWKPAGGEAAGPETFSFERKKS